MVVAVPACVIVINIVIVVVVAVAACGIVIIVKIVVVAATAHVIAYCSFPSRQILITF